ncbi:MAG: histidine kinase [Beijerinckiaceae bacterium]
MPTTFRFLMAVGALIALGYGILFMLANVLEPTPREITVTVPPSRYAK